MILFSILELTLDAEPSGQLSLLLHLLRRSSRLLFRRHRASRKRAQIIVTRSDKAGITNTVIRGQLNRSYSWILVSGALKPR